MATVSGGPVRPVGPGIHHFCGLGRVGGDERRPRSRVHRRRRRRRRRDDREFDTVGLDLSESLVRAANHEVAAAGFVRGDMRNLPFGTAPFDGLWSSASFLHLARADGPGALAEFARVLGEDGALFLSVMARQPSDADAVETADGRRFTFWRKPELVSALDAAEFEVVWDSGQSDWHALVAVRE